MRRARETLEGRGDGGGPRSRSSASESALRGEQTEDRRRSTKGRQPRWHRTLERDGRRGGAGESAPPVCARSRDRAPLLDSPAPKLATRGAMAPSTRSAALATAAAAPAKPSPSVAASNPRKRRQSSPSSATTAAVPATTAARESLGTLAFDDEGDADDADVLAASSDDDGPDAAHEAFPELDLEASDADAGDEDDDDDSFDGSVGSEDEEDDDDDEAQLRAELEDEQNEILSDDDDEDEDPSDLDELIRRNTVKPDEGVAEASAIPGQNAAIGERNGEHDLPPDYMRRSRTVKSKLTGKAKTQWDEDIEPDYASDSSTEEVRPRSLPPPSLPLSRPT